MARPISIGVQDFEKIRTNNYFYVDKTAFIMQWWESADEVTLITRPRRFGKTLNMSMLEQFLSVKYAGRSDLFEGLSIWQEKSADGNYKYRQMQGTWPVLFLSFARVKENSFKEARRSICRIIEEQYNQNDYLLKGSLLNEKEKAFYQEVSADMPDSTAAVSLRSMADFLGRYYGKKVIILLDVLGDEQLYDVYGNRGIGVAEMAWAIRSGRKNYRCSKEYGLHCMEVQACSL